MQSQPEHKDSPDPHLNNRPKHEPIEAQSRRDNLKFYGKSKTQMKRGISLNKRYVAIAELFLRTSRKFLEKVCLEKLPK